MAPRAVPHKSCPGHPALPCLSPVPQGTGSDWKNLLGTAQFLSTQTNKRTDTMFAFIYKMDMHKPNNKLLNPQLEHFWCMEEPWANRDSYNSPRPGFQEATTFPFIIFSMPTHKAYTQMSFCPRIPKFGVPKFLKLRLSRLWSPITSCVHL